MVGLDGAGWDRVRRVSAVSMVDGRKSKIKDIHLLSSAMRFSFSEACSCFCQLDPHVIGLVWLDTVGER